MIYLDNAATTHPKPKSVITAVNNAMQNLSFNPGRGGYSAADRTAEAVFECRKKLGEMFACPPDRVVFTQNCTLALNFCIKGLLKKGDHVITSSLEHNAVMRPLYSMRSLGVEVDIAQVIFGDSEATARSFERLIRPNTRAIICTHASNVTGTVLPIEKIGRICKEKGIIFIVDAAQTAGVLPINMEEMCIDYLCIAAHKGLYAPTGAGALLIRGECPTPIIEGGTGTSSLMLTQPDELPERLESGTLPIVSIVGISAGVDFVRSRGIDNIYSHEIALTVRAFKELGNIGGIRLYSNPPERYFSAPVLAFNIIGSNSEEVGRLLAERGIAVRAGLHCAPSAHKHIGTLDTGAVRIAPSYFTRSEDIDNLLRAVQSIAQKTALINRQKSFSGY